MTSLLEMRGREQSSNSSFARREPPPLLPGGNLFVRSLTARVIASLRRSKACDVAAEFWPSDLVLRAAVAPATTTAAGWAAELAQRIVADAIEALGPASAAAELLRQGLVLNFDGRGIISVPGFVAEFGNAGFVAEGLPIPVRQLAVTPATLQPHKLAAIAVLTNEMAQSSNAEAMIADTLVRAAGRMLDEVLFDANPGDAARPPGLRNGIAALSASNNADTGAAFAEDVVTLVNALAPVGGNGPYVIVASPGRTAMMGVRFIREAGNIVVVASSAVGNDMLAIAPAALVTAMSPEPEVETANSATLHMETAPTAVGSAAPSRSLFQTDSVAIKIRWPVSWSLRDPRGFAWLTPSWK